MSSRRKRTVDTLVCLMWLGALVSCIRFWGPLGFGIANVLLLAALILSINA